ncbi:hypothetical protein CHS0354_040860 [Potamilus streckersoni]|uniref:Cytochrome P450 n=1 Tax=Potamilus streckersoni TaxID=2493646 RepID=A0AAE0VYP0_9BIVA|nr:hypothetical protein CHS0354_040860 [Potamilus streckersoni]
MYSKLALDPGDCGITTNDGLHETDLSLMQKYGRCVGIYLGNIPQLLITEPEMIKQILVKRFPDFTDRPHTLEDSKFMDSAVNLASGEHWKFLRSTLSPTFSSGKMRNMTPLISQCLERLICNGRKMSENGKSVEMKGLFGGYTMDVICSTGFGMEVDSQSNPNDPFVVNATKAMTANLVGPRILLAMIFPDFQMFMRGIPLMDKSAVEFFIEATKSVIQERRSSTSNNYRDLIQLMINAHKEQDTKTEGHVEGLSFDSYKKRGLTDNEVLANALMFLLAAFDTTSSLLTFVSYCLAVNQDVQDKLRSEIDKELGKSQPVYDNVFKLQYLDMVVSETLRIYPPARRFNREALVDTEICGVKIPKGLDVNVPICSLHFDPEFWPNPHKFDPERFSPENKDNIKPFTFLPFGAGPRNCIGMRLALLQAKMAIVGMVQNFRFQTAPDTEIPPKLDKGVFTKPVNGMYLRLEAL